MLCLLDKVSCHRDGAFGGHGSLKEEKWTECSPHAGVVPMFTENVGRVESTRDMMETWDSGGNATSRLMV